MKIFLHTYLTMYMKSVFRLTAYIFLFLVTLSAMAEDGDSTFRRVEFGMEYIGELQTDFKGGYNFLNFLRLDGGLNITKNLHLNLSTISTVHTRRPLMSDIQIFSNIESENIPLTLAVAGVEWEIPAAKGMHTLFAGIRNTGEDYFASNVTSFFVNSSCGIFPTISTNYPIATYPYAAMCLQYAYESEHWGAKATLYNGEGNYRFTGRNNLFRFCPASDGIFLMSQGEYKSSTGRYFLGGSMYKTSPTLWTYGEQSVFESAKWGVHLIAAYSHCFDSEAFCRNFAGLGAKVHTPRFEAGLFTDYADCGAEHEWATELSVRVPIYNYLYIKPSLHYINGTSASGVVGMVRFGVVL